MDTSLRILLWLLAAALLWVPSGWLLPKKHRLIRISYVFEKNGRWWRLVNRASFFNLVRGWLGTVACFAGDNLPKNAFIALSMIPIIGICCQLWRGRDEDNDSLLLAPVCYLMGITLGIMPPVCALGVIVLAMATAGVSGSMATFYVAGAIMTPPLGYFFGVRILDCALIAFLYGLPWLISIILGRPLGLCLLRKNRLVSKMSSQVREVPMMESRDPFPTRLQTAPQMPKFKNSSKRKSSNTRF